MPVVCRNGSLNRTLIVKQNWIAALEKTVGRPGLPSCGESQVMSLSNHPFTHEGMRYRAMDQQRAAIAQRRIVTGPVRRAVAGG
jgi:hypothetical protein